MLTKNSFVNWTYTKATKWSQTCPSYKTVFFSLSVKCTLSIQKGEYAMDNLRTQSTDHINLSFNGF